MASVAPPLFNELSDADTPEGLSLAEFPQGLYDLAHVAPYNFVGRDELRDRDTVLGDDDRLASGHLVK